MSTREKMNPPAPQSQGIRDAGTSALTESSLTPAPDGLLAGVYVAVIETRGEHTPARYRRRVYFNLPSAQRAIDRATMAGLEASIVLCQLTPVEGDLNA